MDLQTFLNSLEDDQSPEVNDYLKALWYLAKDDWEMAHLLVRDIDAQEAFWVHGFLHREKGDAMNAEWWYQKAGRKIPSGSTKEEWTAMVTHFLSAS